MVRRCLILIAFVFAATCASPAWSADSAADPALAREIAAAPPLHDKRVGVSETEPDFCQPGIYRDTNPNAGNRDTIEISPPKFLVEDLAASRTWRHCISVLNRHDEPRTLELSTLDVLGSADPKITVRTEDDAPVVGSWIELLVDQVTLQSGERVLIPYLLRLPDQLPGGTVIGGIRVSDVSAPEVAAGARITTSLVSQLQVTTPGGEAEELKLADISSTRFIWTGRDPEVIRASFTALNSGTVVDTMTPDLVIKGLFGRKVAEVKGTPDVVIPGSAQRTTLRWDGVPFIGVYRPQLQIASTTGTSEKDLPLVIVLPPVPYVIACIVALLLLAFGIWRRRRVDWRAYLDDEDDEDWDPDDDPAGLQRI